MKTTTPSPSSCAVSSVHHILAAATFYFFPSFCWHHLPCRLGMQEGLGQSTKSTIRSSEQSCVLVRAVRSCTARHDVALHLGGTLPRKPSLLVAQSHFLRAAGLERLAAALTGGHFSAAAHVNYCAAWVMYGKLCCAMETSVQRSGLDLQCRGKKIKAACPWFTSAVLQSPFPQLGQRHHHACVCWGLLPEKGWQISLLQLPPRGCVRAVLPGSRRRAGMRVCAHLHRRLSV